MREIRLSVKPGMGRDSKRWLWFLDVAEVQVAEGVEDAPEECFAVAAVTLSHLEARMGLTGFPHLAEHLRRMKVAGVIDDVRRAEEEHRRSYSDGVK